MSLSLLNPRKKIRKKNKFLANFVQEVYGARLGLVNFGGEILCPSSIAEGEVNLGRFARLEAGCWDTKDADENSPNVMTCLSQVNLPI